jgi:hypothetical protein
VTPARVGGRSSFWGAQLCVTAPLYVRLLSGGMRYCMTTSYYIQKDIRGIALLLFFLHQLTINYFKQLNMSTIGNGTAGASGTGLTFICCVCSILIQIKHEREQPLFFHNIAQT